MKTRRLEVDVDLLVAFWHAAHADSVQAVVDSRLLTYLNPFWFCDHYEMFGCEPGTEDGIV